MADELRGTYTGEDEALQGKTALLRRTALGLNAQFDDTSTGFGYGWWFFPKSNFKIEGEE